MGKVIGKIVEVSGLSIKAKLFELLPPYLVTNDAIESAPKINGFVKTRIGLDTAVCQVVGEYGEYSEIGNEDYFLRLEVKGYFGEKGFVQGLRVLPIVSANIELLESSDYKRMFASPSEETISLGNDLYDDSKEINVELNKLMPSHIGVFGNTGSGKSNTLTKVLSSYFDAIKKKNTKNGKFLVFDLNNEYGSSAICDENEKTIYRLSTGKRKSSNKIPLNIKDLNEDDFVVLMNASQKTQAPVVKTAYKNMQQDESENGKQRDEQYYLNYLKNVLLNSRRQLFQSMRFYLGEYITNIDNFKFHSQQGKFYYQQDGGMKIFSDDQSYDYYLNQINIKIPTDTLDRFLFELYFAVAHEYENGVGLDFMMPLISRARKLINDFRKIFDFDKDFRTIFQKKNVCIIQLSSVNKDMKEIVPSIVANNIFNKLQDSKEDTNGELKQAINIVIDEAHNILYDDKKEIATHESVLNVFEKVVKEGRKFGLFLMIASQRPSDISQTIISQLHNYFIHKLVNPADIAMIRKTVAYMDEHSLDFITILAPGECIVSGTAFQMPAFIYIQQVEEKRQPLSRNIELTGKKGIFNSNNAAFRKYIF